MDKVMSEQEFKVKCARLNIEPTIKLWNEYVDACWDQIEKEYQSRLDMSDKGVYTNIN